MRHSIYVFMALLVMALQTVIAADSVPDKSLGLSKTSVFDAPQPQAFEYPQHFPGLKDVSARSYFGAPPQIPHNIESFLPVSKQRNMCLKCHHQPQKKGKKEASQPTPIPPSHYTDLRRSPDKTGKQLVGARYTCTQCHVAQAEVAVLVGNIFKPEKK